MGGVNGAGAATTAERSPVTALYIIDCLSGYSLAAGATEETPPPLSNVHARQLIW